MGNEGAKSISKMLSLTNLSIGVERDSIATTNIRDEGARHLCKLVNLKFLGLHSRLISKVVRREL